MGYSCNKHKKIYSVLSRNWIKNRREFDQVTGEVLCEHTWEVKSSTELLSTKSTKFLKFLLWMLV